MTKSRRKFRPPPSPDPETPAMADLTIDTGDPPDEISISTGPFASTEPTDTGGDGQFSTPFDYLLFGVLRLRKTSGLYKAFLYNDISTCISLRFYVTDDFVKSLDYLNDEGHLQMVSKGECAQFIFFHKFLLSLDPKLFRHEENIFSITFDMWLEFREGEFSSSPKSADSFSTPLRSGSVSKPQPIRSKAEEFRRERRDQSAFMVLKHHSQWLEWVDSMKRQADAQRCKEVLDPHYVPTSQEDIDLFVEQKKYMLAVFDTVLKTEKGRQILGEHSTDGDSQQIFKKVLDYYTDSTNAGLSAQDLLAQIMNTRMATHLKGDTYERFLIKFQEDIRRYDRQVPVTEQLTEPMKKSLLITLVQGVPSLMSVKHNADLLKTATGKEVTYSQYVDLLMSAAQQHDRMYKTNNSFSTDKRKIYNHHLDYSSDGEESTSSPGDNNDSYDVHSTQNHFHQFVPKLHRDQWNKLSMEDKMTWDKLSTSGKSTILSRRSNLAPTSNTRHSQSLRTASLHDVSLGDLLSVFVHHHQDGAQTSDIASPPIGHDSPSVNHTGASSDKNTTHPGSLQRLLGAKSSSQNTKNDKNNKDSKRNAHFSALDVNVADTYLVSTHARHDPKMSLIDRGANGGVGGEDVRLIFTLPERFVDIQGIDNHQLTKVPIGTVGGVIETQDGPRIAIFHQYAYTGKGPTIHSSAQLEHAGQRVDDRSAIVGGTQRIISSDGYIIPLVFSRGLCRLSIRPFTDDEFNSLPHIIMTSELDWDPSVLDHRLEDNDWKEFPTDIEGNTDDTNLFDEFGNYRSYLDTSLHHLTDMSISSVRSVYEYFFTKSSTLPTVDVVEAHFSTINELDEILDCVVDSTQIVQVNNRELQVVTPIPPLVRKAPDFESLRPLFAYLPSNIIELTFKNTTQYARIYNSPVLKKHFHSPHPALNVSRRKEAIATDTIYSNTPALGSGVKHAQLFVGTSTYVTDVYPIKTQTQFSTVLTDVITDRGAPTRLLSDRAKAELSKKVKDILRTLFIGSWTSEAGYQHQNFAERRIQDVKRMCNTVLDRTAAPDSLWFECLEYVVDVLNHTYNGTIRDVPLRALNGDTPDISPFLRFRFYEKVYYRASVSSFPSDSREDIGYFVGISKNVGHLMTFKILTIDSNTIIHRSAVRSTTSDANRRIEPIDGEMPPPSDPPDSQPTASQDQVQVPEVVKIRSELEGVIRSNGSTTPIIHPSDLVGRTFLYDQQRDDGQKFRGKILEIIDDLHENEENFENNRDRILFRCSINNGEFDDLLTYGQLMEFINKDIANPIIWKCKKIISHEGPFTEDDPNFKGSKYNIMVEWETGEVTNEPLDLFAKDSPVECAIYAKENDLLYQPGWRRFRKIANKKDKIFQRIVNQARLRSYNTAPKFKYGFEVPRNFQHAVLLDSKNGNTKWMDATIQESESLHEYSTFRDMGHKDKVRPPEGYKKIKVHFIYDVKHDGRHKARLVADGHLTDLPLDSIYAGVVSIRGIRLVVFLAELNGLQLYATDVGNAYLEAKTKEKVYIIAGPEFGKLQDHVLIIDRALYGLRSSNYRWAERLADVLRDMGFQASKSEPDIWMREKENLYEYVAVYVDDLLVASKSAMDIINPLTSKYLFKLKGTGPVSYHLGMNFFRDGEGKLSYAPRQYLERMFANFERVFGHKPKEHLSPLEPNDHPELDTTDLLDDEKTRTYQSLIGALQWLITIGRIDIFSAVMSMSSFRSAPRVGHMQRLKRIYGYLYKFRHSAIRMDTTFPDMSTLPTPNHDWDYSVYGKVTEIIPSDIPEPLGKMVVTLTYVDANLYHDMLSGKSVTGILHFVNKTPYEWYCKKQATVETATYGSEFSAARTAVDQIVDMRNTLRYLGIPISNQSYMFGDNKTVVDSASNPGSKLHKRHTMLSFHRVREAIAAGMIVFHYIPGEENPADILSKHWAYGKVWKNIVKPLLFIFGGNQDDDLDTG